MRILLMCLLAIVCCSGQSCAPPPDQPLDEDEQVAGSDPETPDPGDDATDPNDTTTSDENDAPDNTDGSNDETTSDGPPLPVDPETCYTGHFSCRLGPEVIDCGVWQFQVNQANAITGTGTIQEGFGTGPVDVTLGGLFDLDQESIAVDLISDDGGGVMFLQLDQADLSLAGSWVVTQEPGPDAVSVAGDATGTPCDP